MEEIRKFDTIADYNKFNNHETLHPLVTVVNYSDAKPRVLRKSFFGFYAVMLKDSKCGDLRYGNNYYDYQEGTLVFIGPGQIAGVENSDEVYQPKGYGLAFHPDLIAGTSLGRAMNEYSFFNYSVTEALHLSERERQIVMDCLSKIQFELEHDIDKHSKQLIVSNIELFLNYCVRFYDRQFVTRDNANKGILERFEKLLNEYYASEKPQVEGIPTVKYCASELNLSSNYFGDLIKKETGTAAHEYIQSKVIDLAKTQIFDPAKSISQIAYDLGFKYPQHFARLFKQKVGMSPNEYRTLN